MSGFICRSICVLALLFALPAPSRAQENLDSGKSPAQLFASDCSVCHKSPQGLAAKAGGFGGLEGFLREHYTASRESAAAIAGYLRAVGSPAAPARNAKRPPKGDDKGKAGDKTGDKKPDSAKSTGPKPADAKASEQKPSEPKPAESDVKPAEPKAEPKAAEPKPAEGGKSE